MLTGTLPTLKRAEAAVHDQHALLAIDTRDPLTDSRDDALRFRTKGFGLEIEHQCAISRTDWRGRFSGYADASGTDRWQVFGLGWRRLADQETKGHPCAQTDQEHHGHRDE